MQSLKNEFRYLGRRYVPWLYEAYLRWRNHGTENSQQEDWQNWDKRAEEAISCPDNEHLEHVPGAGSISGKWQLMHNGLKVATDCYYGAGGTHLLQHNRGSHEPQEELLFGAVLAKMQKGATMIECGAYWSFYSMWFCKIVPGAKVYMVEPDLLNLRKGRKNFAKNGYNGVFINAYVGEASGRSRDGTEVIAIDEFAIQRALTVIDLLHCDIQGSEMCMLHGAEQLLRNKAIRFLFVSTHTQELHRDCLTLLQNQDYRIVSSINLEESYSFDGIIVAARPEEDLSGIPEPSKRERLKSSGDLAAQ